MKIAIFEDEPHNTAHLIRLLQNQDIPIQVIQTISSVKEGMSWLAANPNVDLLLMDIQLTDGNCFEIFETCKVATPIIFTTAYDNFALQAFSVNSIDYLLKPIEAKKLAKALEKYRTFSGSPQLPDFEKLAMDYFRRDGLRFLGRLNNQLVYVKVKEIAFIKLQRSVPVVTTYTGQKIPLDYSLEKIDSMLDKRNFFRINRQMIIHLDAIKKINTYYNSRYIVQLSPSPDEDVIISRERATDFRSWLEGSAV